MTSEKEGLADPGVSDLPDSFESGPEVLRSRLAPWWTTTSVPKFESCKVGYEQGQIKKRIRTCNL